MTMDPNYRRILVGSPTSSEAIPGSLQNTPETQPTAFSPEELRSEKHAYKTGIARQNVPPPFALHVYSKPGSSNAAANLAASGSSDPFVVSSSTAAAGYKASELPKLSPVASSFTPSAGPKGLSLPASVFKHGDETADHRSAIPGPSTAFGSLLPSRVASPPGTEGAAPANLQLYPPGSSESKTFAKVGNFSTEFNTSRYLMVSHVPLKTTSAELESVFPRSIFPTLRHIGTNDLALTGNIYLSFSDIRESLTAYTKVGSLRREWTVVCIGTAPYFQKTYPGQPMPPLVFEGQISIKVEYGGPATHFNAASIGLIVKEALENYGDVMAMETTEVTSPSVTFRAEFYDSMAVNGALTSLQGFKIAGCTLNITNYGTGDTSLTTPSKPQGPLIIGQDDTGLENVMANMNMGIPQATYGHNYLASPLVSPFFMPQAANRSFAYHRELNSQQVPSPLSLQKTNFNGPESTESSSWSPFFSPYGDPYGLQSPFWTPYTPGAIGQERGTPIMSPYTPGAIGQDRGNSIMSPYSGIYPYQQRTPGKLIGRSPHDYSSGHHNVVDVERIRQGLDVRTTIMLRNIPNKIDQTMLKEIVDETSHGKYDFMYLRIDFANNCNVGYAFINFEDPYYIIDFMNARAGHRWNRFNSDKVAEVSYATIQGRDCLIQKFRNSSVMLEHPSFRPKIFHTGTGPLAGTEDSFPGPDNPSKMRRSVENAEHVGLFAPRAGQHFRDEQRRRRSQYDRGTRLAEMEDAYDVGRREYRADPSLYYPGPSLRYRRSTPYLPSFEEY